jgi:Co/Zn/Cd efflux system component
MSAHIVVESEVDKKMLLKKIIDTLKEDFGVDHTTIQMEDEGYPKAASEHK